MSVYKYIIFVLILVIFVHQAKIKIKYVPLATSWNKISILFYFG